MFRILLLVAFPLFLTVSTPLINNNIPLLASTTTKDTMLINNSKNTDAIFSEKNQVEINSPREKNLQAKVTKNFETMGTTEAQLPTTVNIRLGNGTIEEYTEKWRNHLSPNLTIEFLTTYDIASPTGEVDNIDEIIYIQHNLTDDTYQLVVMYLETSLQTFIYKIINLPANATPSSMAIGELIENNIYKTTEIAIGYENGSLQVIAFNRTVVNSVLQDPIISPLVTVLNDTNQPASNVQVGIGVTDTINNTNDKLVITANGSLVYIYDENRSSFLDLTSTTLTINLGANNETSPHIIFNPTFLTVADVDGDLRDEILLINNNTELQIHGHGSLNNPGPSDGSYGGYNLDFNEDLKMPASTEWKSIIRADSIVGLSVGNIDNEGANDIALASQNGTLYTIAFSGATSPFYRVTYNETVGTSLSGIVVSNLIDSDVLNLVDLIPPSRDEIVVMSANPGIMVYTDDDAQNGVNLIPSWTTTLIKPPYQPISGDIDGDGKQEFVFYTISTQNADKNTTLEIYEATFVANPVFTNYLGGETVLRVKIIALEKIINVVVSLEFNQTVLSLIKTENNLQDLTPSDPLTPVEKNANFTVSAEISALNVPFVATINYSYIPVGIEYTLNGTIGNPPTLTSAPLNFSLSVYKQQPLIENTMITAFEDPTFDARTNFSLITNLDKINVTTTVTEPSFGNLSVPIYDPSQVPSSNITVEYIAENGSRIRISMQPTEIPTTAVSSVNFTATIPENFSVGYQLNISIIAVDFFGYMTIANYTVTIQAVPKPMVSSNPADGSTISGAPTITFTVSENFYSITEASIKPNVTTETFQVDTIEGNTLTYTFDTRPYENGAVQLELNISFFDGSVYQYSFTFIIDNPPPTIINVTGITDETTIEENGVTIKVNISSPVFQISSLSAKVDSTVVGSANQPTKTINSSVSEWELFLDFSTVSNGTYNLTLEIEYVTNVLSQETKTTTYTVGTITVSIAEPPPAPPVSTQPTNTSTSSVPTTPPKKSPGFEISYVIIGMVLSSMVFIIYRRKRLNRIF